MAHRYLVALLVLLASSCATIPRTTLCGVDVDARAEHITTIATTLRQYNMRTGVDACPLLDGARIVIEEVDTPARQCVKRDTCVVTRDHRTYTIYLYTRSRFPVVDAVTHEVLHVVLWRAGVPTKRHHQWMTDHFFYLREER